MDVVTLNEQLREQFASVVKQFIAIRREEITRVASAQPLVVPTALLAAAGSTATAPTPPVPTVEPSPTVPSVVSQPTPLEPEKEPAPHQESAPKQPPSADASLSNNQPVVDEKIKAYATLAKTILWRTNSYYYRSRDQFARDIEQLLGLASYNNQKLILSHLLSQFQDLVRENGAPPTPPRKRHKVNGIRVDNAGIPGIQEHPDGKWVCNISLQGHVTCVATCFSREKAIAEYCDLRKSPVNMKMIHDEGQKLARARAKLDRAILADSMKQVKQRIPIHKLHDVGSLAALPPPPVPLASSPSTASQQPQAATANVASTKDKETKPSRKRELVVDTANGPNSKSIMPASAVPDLVSERTPIDSDTRMSFLRLRRLMQMRLCRHLDGREVAVYESDGGERDWTAVGRLERGKVLSYATKKHMSFADFVSSITKRSVAACSHLYLLETRENIDSHLLVCDQFDDDVRQQLGRNFKEVSERYMLGKL